MSILDKLSFKDRTFKLREQAILDATTQLLAGRGFDLMTMDDVAQQAGISKPSLYKHFKSKEDLATEVMIKLLDGALAFLDKQPAGQSPQERLEDLLKWALRVRLAGGLPFLPSSSSQVREMLTRNLRYVTRVFQLNKTLESIVEKGKAEHQLRADLPTNVILFNYYSRTCDPAVEYLQIYGKYNDDEIVDYMLQVSFQGFESQFVPTNIPTSPKS